jgi:adenylate kinase family enzyme
VVGTTGSGKTTLARTLAAMLGYPHVELDALFWGPGWSMAELPIFRSRVAAVVSGDGWVVDGGYSDVRDLVWARADTVVWLDYPLAVTLSRLMRRIVARIRDGTELWPGTGNRETVRNQVFTRDPLVWFAIRTHHSRRRRINAVLAQPENAHLHVHRFIRPADADRWLEAQRKLMASRI